MKTQLIDRRKAVRIKGNFSLELGRGKRLKVGETIDFSLRGMCCEADGRVPVFEEIEIRFELPTLTKDPKNKNQVLFCKGVLVRCEPAKTHGKYQMAFYFTEWDLESKKKMTAYIKERSLSHAA